MSYLSYLEARAVQRSCLGGVSLECHRAAFMLAWVDARDSRIVECLTHRAATELEVAVTTHVPLMSLLELVPDPRRAEGKLYKLPHVLLFSILAIVTGCNSYRGIVPSSTSTAVASTPSSA